MCLKTGKNHLDLQMEKIRDRIGIGIDGCTLNERYEDTLKENKYVKAEALDSVEGAVRKGISENWPLDDHEEHRKRCVSKDGSIPERLSRCWYIFRASYVMFSRASRLRKLVTSQLKTPSPMP